MSGSVSDLLLLPVMGVQAIWVIIRAQRLPEAAGPRKGRDGNGKPLKILIVGDSSAAGVGVDHQDSALSGRLSAHLSDRYAVEWSLVAKSGATTGSVLTMLDRLEPAEFDVAVIALGVNDSKNGVSLARWKRNYAALIDLLAVRCGVSSFCLSGLPPMGHFPLLPNPLRRALGRRAAVFDEYLRETASDQGNVVHIPLDFTLDTALMASDGFHPGPEIYDQWALRVAAAITDQLGAEDAGASDHGVPGGL